MVREFLGWSLSNSRLRVRLIGDVEAWRRRMLLIRFERPKPEHRIAEFSEKACERGRGNSGVVVVRGAMRHLGELRELGISGLRPAARVCRCAAARER